MVTLPLVSWWLEDPEFNSRLVHYLSCLCVLQLLDRIATCYRMDWTGSCNLATRLFVIWVMRVGCGSSDRKEIEGEFTWLVIHEVRDGTDSLGEKSGTTAGKVAAIGKGSRALRVGPEGGIWYGKIVAFPCNRPGLKVFPEGDHMKAIFVPKGSRVPGGKFEAAALVPTIFMINLKQMPAQSSVSSQG